MNRKRSKLVQVMAVSLVVIGLLIAAWPGVAQNERPPQRLLQEYLRDPEQFTKSIDATMLEAMQPRLSDKLPLKSEVYCATTPPFDDIHTRSKAVFSSYRDNDWEIYIRPLVWPWPEPASTRLTFSPGYDSTPKLNHGASSIAFVSKRDGSSEIYVMNVDGSAQTRLTFNNANDLWPTWSPDGTKIAFYSDRDGNYEIYTMNSDGSNQTRLTFDPAWDGHPDWSPDGARLAFASDRTGTDNIWTMQANGTNQVHLTNNLVYASFPRWSKDGSTIALSYDSNGDGWLDFGSVYTSNGHLLPSVMSLYGRDHLAPFFSPDGSYRGSTWVDYVYYQNQYYWWQSQMFYDCTAVNVYFGGRLTDSQLDWWGDWNLADLAAPQSQVTPLPQWNGALGVQLLWSGGDLGDPITGIASFDIQYRDGLNGTWTNWLVATNQTSATFNGTNGHTYYFRSRARDYANNLEAYPGGNGDTYTTVDTIAPTSSASAPLYATSLQIPVTWSGADPVSGIMSYDLQVRDGAAGTWDNWLMSTALTSGIYPGQLGHTYYFQSRARDKAGNLEAYPYGDGDTLSHAPLYVLNSQALGNRDQFIAQAQALTAPAALNQSKSDHLGNFGLYYNLSGTYSLTVTRADFGSLPPMANVTVSATSSNPIVYLPPLDNQIGDSHFESGDLSAWIPNGASGDLTPTITSTAHTGNYAALLGGSVPTDTITTGPWHSTIEQTINISPMIVSGTLSLLYRVDAVEPLSDTLNAYLIGANNVLTFTLPVTTSVWIHAWFDVSAWAEPTATVKIDFAVDGVGREARIILDEITWGSAITGSHAVFLPVVRR